MRLDITGFEGSQGPRTPALTPAWNGKDCELCSKSFAYLGVTRETYYPCDVYFPSREGDVADAASCSSPSSVQSAYTLGAVWVEYISPSAPPASGRRREMLTNYGTWPTFARAKDLKLVEHRSIYDEIIAATTRETWTQWAGCSVTQITIGSPGAPPLPCRTGASPATCFDGSRRCGTLDENSRDPYIEFDVDAVRQHYYLFAIEFTLPDSPVYGPLLFKSYYETGGRGYTVTLTDDHRLPLRVGCLPWSEQNVAFWTEGLRRVQHRCARVLASDSDLEELGRARHVKITLDGENRQLWMDSIDIVFRNLVEQPPSPPVPPQSPHLPPQPKAPPDAPSPSVVGNCTTFFGQYLVPREATILLHEPCGQTPEQCCQHAYENGASGFQINGAGCCDLLTVNTVGVAMHESPTDRGWISGRVVN
jgi:hypothetical protein